MVTDHIAGLFCKLQMIKHAFKITTLKITTYPFKECITKSSLAIYIPKWSLIIISYVPNINVHNTGYNIKRNTKL